MAAPIDTGNDTMDGLFREAGTTVKHDPATGQVVVTNWPKPRWTGSPPFLSDALGGCERERTARIDETTAGS